eukprot:761398-Hanusia_phi.AAC.1
MVEAEGAAISEDAGTPSEPTAAATAPGKSLSTEEQGVLNAFEKALQEKIEQSVLDAVEKMMKE